jgi:hypothetical protein
MEFWAKDTEPLSMCRHIPEGMNVQYMAETGPVKFTRMLKRTDSTMLNSEDKLHAKTHQVRSVWGYPPAVVSSSVQG